MCGIAAAVPADRSAVEAALAGMSHRGPDATAVLDDPRFTLGVVRLAITDLAHGDQPLRSPGGRAWVVFNGAVYNHHRILDEVGVRAPSGNDGHVVGILYEKYGLRFADHLEGMYAVCLYDLEQDLLVVAVDGIGVKPLYAARRGGALFVSSTPETIPAELRPFACRVAPGTVWSSRGDVVAISPRPREGTLRDLVVTAVRDQIPAEVRWGCMLSGGLDSSLLTAIATREVGLVSTFTAGLEGSADLDAAREVAAYLGTDHHEVIFDEAEIPDLLDAVVTHTVSPDVFTVLGGVGTWLTARLAHDAGVRVLLSGEGADELFGGYGFYADLPPAMVEPWMRFEQRDLGARECLRLDRCAMAHHVEARVPYLDSAVVAHARALPPARKIDYSVRPARQKVALREIAEEFLPAHLAHRPKMPFPDGAGYLHAVGRFAAGRITGADLAELFEQPEAAAFLQAAPEMQGYGLRTAAYLWQRWSALFPDLSADYRGLVRRGLLRRTLRHGTYTREDFLAAVGAGPGAVGSSGPPID
ncbi:asparagine synthase-related protein [Micromonospora sp. WMMD1076]|uniref:asparagine synthetase B family protein n=1 Tax=Micromonospora sp. WMMD1076 TaxID=3016103 RepID=UPI00249A2156|nr:asparagine synthase-related protein [Micromonospora sp. WMMD1076]WFF06200.1 asparagine synthase-related protein [Micromonospora sp. WMMD1076]